MSLNIRPMVAGEWPAVAELIHVSTNYWYEANRHLRIFRGGPESCIWFCRVYEALDPGCCLVAETEGAIVGSCFYRIRPTHVSLGIMNAHPSYFGRGIAAALLQSIIKIARDAHKPLRLVSSAMNLDSFSLYNRAGFVPRKLYQDMYLAKPLDPANRPAGAAQVREANLADVPAMVALERELAGLDRARDFTYFIENGDGIWRTLVLDAPNGKGLAGLLVSVNHPSSSMLGPGVMRDNATARALIWRQLELRSADQPVFLIPCDATDLLADLYRWGARNCEIHMHNVLGEWFPTTGIHMPTFMPETA